MLIIGIALLALMILAGTFQRWDSMTGKQLALEVIIVLTVIALVYWTVTYA